MKNNQLHISGVGRDSVWSV